MLLRDPPVRYSPPVPTFLEKLRGDPDRVRLVFHYEITPTDADRAAQAVIAAAR